MSDCVPILFVSLFMVIPQGPSATSPDLIGSGIFSLAVVAPSLIAAGRGRTLTLRPYQLASRFGTSALGYVAVTVAGVFLGRGSEAAAFN